MGDELFYYTAKARLFPKTPSSRNKLRNVDMRYRKSDRTGLMQESDLGKHW